MSDHKQVDIYTDGACIGNPGPGGYGIVLKYGLNRKEASAGFRLTTNNRMELLGAIVGLRQLKMPCVVTVYSDSKYLVDTMVQGWVYQWRAKAWRRSKDAIVPNADLWIQLLDACKLHEVKFVWVQGHAGQPDNERCDYLSVRAVEGPDLLVDEGYEQAVQAQQMLF